MDQSILGAVGYLAGGAIAGFAAGSPAEWKIHQYMLHTPKSQRNWLNNSSSIAHNDKHHAAYNLAHHYYLDATNKHVVIHFSKGDVGLISAISAGLGLAGSAALHYGLGVGSRVDMAAATAGFTIGAMAYYSMYELTHHFMHDIGARRFAITKLVGDVIQNNKPDSNLRIPKPTLDDICNAVERNIDAAIAGKKRTPYSSGLISDLNLWVDYNQKLLGEKKPVVEITDANVILDEVTRIAINTARTDYYSKSSREKVLYKARRLAGRTLRENSFFKMLDNHHFAHHLFWGKNLNVALPWMDYLAGTKVDSSPSALRKEKRFYLCPNTTQAEPFTLV